jgi:hypothetical protein
MNLNSRKLHQQNSPVEFHREQLSRQESNSPFEFYSLVGRGAGKELEIQLELTLLLKDGIMM